ncbi:MAG TPA: hydrogenase maturation protease [bacterium]|nr:hydrogenase maturation protease [bacterium]
MASTEWKNTLVEFLSGYTKLVIIGVGNELRGDDVVGLKIVEGLQKAAKRNDVSLVLAGSVIENYIGPVLREQPSHILICDAVATATYPAGTILTLRPEELESSFHSSHTMPLSFFLQLVSNEQPLKALGLAIVAQQIGIGDKMSQIVAKSVADVVGSLQSMLATL